MADQKVKSAPAAAQLQETEILEKAIGFWEKNSKIIIYVSSAVIVLILGWFGYKNYILQPKEDKAAELIFPAEHVFDKMALSGFNADSVNLVLKGGDGVTGVVKIAKEYSGTAAGNLANYYAGACYLHTGDFNNAIKYLQQFSTKATQIQSRAYSMIGDAYSELKKNEDALSYYKKAASVNDKDETITPAALYREGLFAESIGKTDDAIACYQKIKDNYPKSQLAGDMDKYLARLGVLK